MAKANSTQPIPPFPADIDRTAFGHWLSGFSDGEACFVIQDGKPRRVGDKRPSLTCEFAISLRRDDLPVLQLIQSYWQCGGIVHYDSYGRTPGNPSSRFYVHKTSCLTDILIPHFDRYPMFAKKARDFLIWKKAVLLKAGIAVRKYRGLPSGKGCTPKWTDAEIAHYRSLKAAMESGRKYNATATEIPPPPLSQKESNLFG